MSFVPFFCLRPLFLLASSGTWDVQVLEAPVDVPAPAAALLGGVGLLVLGAIRTLVKKRTTQLI